MKIKKLGEYKGARIYGVYYEEEKNGITFTSIFPVKYKVVKDEEIKEFENDFELKKFLNNL